jgi:PKD repeat protein
MQAPDLSRLNFFGNGFVTNSFSVTVTANHPVVPYVIYSNNFDQARYYDTPTTNFTLAGSLPPGLSLIPQYGEGGLITSWKFEGIPTLRGTYNFSLIASGPYGNDSQNYEVKVVLGYAIPKPLTFQATVGVPFIDKLEVRDPVSSPVVNSESIWDSEITPTGLVPPLDGGPQWYTRPFHLESGDEWSFYQGQDDVGSMTSLTGGFLISMLTGQFNTVPLQAGTYNLAVKIKYGAYGTNATQNLPYSDRVNLNTAPPWESPAIPIQVNVSQGSLYHEESGSLTTKAGESFSALPTIAGTFRWSATGLPAGLSINASTGQISGIPTAIGTFVANISASGSNSIVKFEISAGTPIISPNQSIVGASNVQFNRRPALTGESYRPVTSWSATGLPSWANFNTSTGVITGTPAAFESSTITLTATGPGGSDTETATISISQAAPIITSGQSFSGTVTSGSGLAFNGQITTLDSENRPVTSWSATGLPPGLSINSAGSVSGFPSQAGEFTATITATGPAGSDTELVSFSIAIGAPLISGNQIFNGEIGVNFTATITSDNTTNRPVTSWAASGLPSWASFNTATAVISGLPTTDANTVVTLTATGPGGNSSRTVTINIDSLQGGTIVRGRTVTRVGDWSPTDLSFAGTIFSGSGYRWRTEPIDSGDSGTIPPGMSISPSNNARANITGTASALGRYRGRAIFEYSADFYNFETKGQSPFDVKVIGLPQIVSAQIFSGVIGEPFSVTLAGVDTANRPVTRWSATGLPEWASMSAAGIISGIPVANGNFPITLIALGPAGTTTSPATIIVAAGPPRITPSQIFTGRQGFIFTGAVPSLENVANRPVTSWSATGLPDGLSINPVTGIITGTPTGHGEFTVIITAIGSGGEDSEPIFFLIAESIPIFRGATRATAVYAGATEGKAIYYGPSLLWNAAGWEPSTFQNNLLAFYRLNDDGSGALSLADSSGNNRTLTNANAAALSSGAIQGSALFTGNSQFLTAGIPFNPAQPYSISMWVNVSTLKNYFSIIAGSTGGTLNIHGDSSGGLSWNNASSGDFSQSGFFTANQWMHCVFVRGSGNAMTVYKNGTLVKTATGSTNYSPITLVDIGNVRHMGGFQFAGKIDAIGIWDRALTTAEIGKLYNSGTGFEF